MAKKKQLVKLGRPAHYPSVENQVLVADLYKNGVPQEAIAAKLGISDDTLRKHYREQLKTCRIEDHKEIVAKAIALAKEGNETMIKYYLDNLGGEEFRPKARQLEVSGPNGGPVAVQQFNFDQLPDEQLDYLENVLEAVIVKEINETLDGLVDDPVSATMALRDIKRTKLERHLYKFAEKAWTHIDPAPFIGGGFAMQAICEHLQACSYGHIRNLIINVPPRFSKSTLTGTLFPAWVWSQKEQTPLRGPGVQFLFASYSQNLALQDSIKCRRLVESDWYMNLWGDRVVISSDQNTKSQFDLLGGGRRNTVSVGGSTTGMGGNYLIADDPNNAREANSEAVLASTIEWWDMAWSTRLNDPKTGCRIVIQQRLSEEDITGHILSKDVGHWTHLCLPMKFEPERRTYNVLYPEMEDENGDTYEEIVWTDPRTEAGELLWPERFGEQEIDLLERTLGPWATAGQLQQRPEPKGGGIINRDWWQLWEGETFPQIEYMVAALDTAYTEKAENDFSAMSVWGVFRGGDEKAQITRAVGPDGTISASVTRTYNEDQRPKVILMYAWQVRLQLHDLVKKVQDTMRQYKIEKLLIENKATGIPVAQELRRLYGYEEFVVQLVDPRGQMRSGDKVSRIHSIAPLFADGLIYAPDRSWADMMITQVANFPKAKHDDLVDTVYYALKHLRETGYLVRGDEWTADVEDRIQFRGNTETPLYGAV